MLPAVLDAGAALGSLGQLLRCRQRPTWHPNFPGSKGWLDSVRAKAKLQQVMMTIVQRVNFEFVSGRCQCPGQRPCRCAGYGQRPGRNDSESCRAGPLARGSTLPCRRGKSDSRARCLPIDERCGRSSASSEWMCRRACDIARSCRRPISGLRAATIASALRGVIRRDGRPWSVRLESGCVRMWCRMDWRLGQG
jgi:hypothetical protein